MGYRIITGILLFILILVGSVSAQEATETPDAAEMPEATDAVEQTPAVEQTAEATQVAEANPVPPEMAAHFEDWPLAHKDYRNTRATFNSNINSSTVSQMEVAWTFPIPGRANYGAAASAPLIIAGVVYFQDLESNVFALDLRDGSMRWQKLYSNGVIGPNGPGVGYGKVFVTSGVDEFAALDIATGEEIWTVDTGDWPTGAIQPYAYNETLYITTQAGVGGEGDQSFRGYAPGTSGHILALDQATGETIWEFQTVEEGFWGNPEVNSGGGVWFSPAIDTETGLTFWGIGNPAPFPGTFDYPNASSRQGENLYTNSILALDHQTGELVWYNHVNPNDLFDLDFQASPILATIQLEGRSHDIVIGSGKMGHVIAFDRETGEIIWNTPVGIHQNDNLTEIPPNETVIVYPGVLGGVETPMAYADETVYAPVLNLPTEYEATAFGAKDGSEAVQAADGHTPVGNGTGELVALDANTGRVKWSHEFPADLYGGATVVNDLVFTATFDGIIYALNRATGKTVWSYQSPAGINAWPAVADDMIIWPAGFGNEPVLIAFRLGDGAPESTAEATTEATPEDGAEATAEATDQAGDEATPEAGAEAAAETTPEEDAEATAEATAEGGAEATAEATEAADGGQAQETEFISIDDANQTVTLTVIAALDSSNGGMNFNGFADGNATYTVPEGWTVNVQFDNSSNLPHSAMIVPLDSVNQTELPEPIFEGASTNDPYAGQTSSSEFSFTASEQGEYAMACGVPGHSAQGQWIYFIIGSSDTQPSFETGG